MAEFTITATCTVTDPGERQRRLTQVYGLLLDLARRGRAAGKAEGRDAASRPDSSDGSSGGAGK